MFISTLQDGFDRPIKATLGLIAGHSVRGINIARDIIAGLHNVFGGKVGGYETEVKRAQEDALQDLVKKAKKLHANAVIGVRFDTEFIVIGKGAIVMSTVYGTAVVMEEPKWKKQS